MVSRKVTKDYFDDYGKRNAFDEENLLLIDKTPDDIPYEEWIIRESKRQRDLMNPNENPDRLPVGLHTLVKKASERQAGGQHYKDFPIQPAEYCQKNKLGFMESNVVKYVSRHDRKGKAKDIKKAIHMLELLLEFEYGEQYKQGEEV